MLFERKVLDCSYFSLQWYKFKSEKYDKYNSFRSKSFIVSILEINFSPAPSSALAN